MIHAQTQLKELRARIANEVDRIYEAVNNEYQLAVAREQAVREKLAKQKAEKVLLDKHAVKYSLLEREANSNRQLYDLFLQQMKRTDLSTEIKTSNMYLAEPAMPTQVPVKPNTRRNALLGILMGLVSGIGIALLSEYTGKTFKGPRDLSRYLAGLQFLGWLPRCSERRKGDVYRMMEIEPLGMAADCFRHIRTSVWLAMGNDRPFSLAVTSPGESEGKTTVAVNLAMAMSQLEDLHVVLIDLDLRRPQIANVFGINDEKKDKSNGLVQYLEGEVGIKEILHQTAFEKRTFLPLLKLFVLYREISNLFNTLKDLI